MEYENQITSWKCEANRSMLVGLSSVEGLFNPSNVTGGNIRPNTEFPAVKVALQRSVAIEVFLTSRLSSVMVIENTKLKFHNHSSASNKKSDANFLKTPGVNQAQFKSISLYTKQLEYTTSPTLVWYQVLIIVLVFNLFLVV